MDASTETTLRTQLGERRRQLAGAISGVGEAADLVRLLQEVDSALSRLDSKAYGVCEVCKDKVEEDFLLANPLIQYCLCTLTPAQQAILQNDLELAARIQWALLPRQELSAAGWTTHYRYEPHGPVSGDYCDLIEDADPGRGLHFLVGDVSGKGVAASLLMAHLNALVRSLVGGGLPVAGLVERANRLFGENAFSSSHYVTLVCGHAGRDGEVEVCNAGHCPPVLVRRDGITTMNATGFPVGIVRSGPYQVSRAKLDPGDTLFLYTDGLTEAADPEEQEYGAPRLTELLRRHASLPPRELAAACLEDMNRFRAGAPRSDDLTILVLRRTG
jgi:sigma-B regulation protein RsbU (phosphoserine phosphatase)